MPALPLRVVLTPAQALRTARRRGRGDDGFSLVETVIALVVFSLVMASLAAVFLTSTRQVGSLRDRQTAASIAQQALEIARSVQAAPDTNGCPKLLQGRSQSAVAAQWAAAPSGLDLSTTDIAWMPSNCTGSLVVPLQGLARTAVSAPIDPLVVAGQSYTVKTYVGTCTMLVAGGACLPAGQLTGRFATLFRVVATVSWGGPGCGTGCSYSAATLIDPSTDPLFNARNALPVAPVGLAAAPGESSAAMTWQAPATSNGATIVSYTVTATPIGGGATSTCSSLAPITSCTLTGLTNGVTYTATVAGRSSYATGAPSAAAQFIPYPASVMSPARMVLWLDGADSSTLLASSACTGAPATAAVGCWKDKSTQVDNAVQGTGTSQPALTTVATRQVPGFDGSSDYLDLTVAKLPTGLSTATAFVVGTMTDPTPAAGSHRSLLNYGTVAGGAEREIQKESGTTNVRATLGGAGVLTAPVWSSSATIAATTWTSTGLSLWTSGSSGTTTTATYPGTGTAYAHVGAFGPSGSTGQYWYGAVPEVIVLNTTVTAAERRLVEEYLARKWSAALVPGAPTGVAVSSIGSTTASVSFTAPGYDGGSAVTGYTVVATPAAGAPVTVSCAASPCALTGLTASTAYTVTVAAVNAKGTGATSTAVPFTTTAQLTGAPTNVVAVAGDASAAVSWTAPTLVGTGITGYTVTATPTAGTGFASAAVRTCTTAGATSCTVTNLVNGLTYSVVVTASNAAGPGTPSTAVTVTPYPATLMSGATLKLWLDGADPATLLASSGCTGAAATTTVGCWTDKSANANHFSQAAAGNRPTLAVVGARNVPGFDGATSYLTGSAATLPTGGAASATFVVARMTDPAPTSSGYRTALTWGSGVLGQSRSYQKNTLSSAAISVAWSGTGASAGSWPASAWALLDDAFSGTGYSANLNGVTGTAVSGTFSTGTAAALVGAQITPYAFWHGQLGENIVLQGPLTATQRRTVQEYLARKWLLAITPSAPTILSATGTTTTASVAFTAPSFDGGSTITSYTVTAVPTTGPTVTASCSASPCSLTGLVAGMAYTVTMTAANAVGTGPASASTALSTFTVPGSPTGLAATAADSSASLTWTAPANTGGGISSYTATGVPGDGSANVTCTSATTACTLTGLTNGVTYTVTVKATNAAGTGAASSSVTVLPYPKNVMTSTALKLWLDGADSSTLIASNSCSGAVATTTIGCWKDKSTQANNADQTWSWQFPTLSSINGRTAPNFDGLDDEYDLDVAKLPVGTTPSSIYTVAVQEDSLPTWSCFRHVLGWGTAFTGQTRAVEKGCYNTNAYLDTFNTYASMNPTRTWPTNVPTIFDANVTSTGVTVGMVGAQSYTWSGSNNTGTFNGAQVGSAPWSTGNWDGRIAEVIVTNTNASAAENRSIEEYLARKWGISITPSAPSGVTATPLATTATVAFTAPWNGGPAITSYTATAVPSSGPTVTGSCAASPCSLTGLAPGTAYTVTVTATNALGTGAASAGTAMTTLIAPGAPTGVTATPSDSAVAVSWTAPAVVGSGITGYTVTATPTAGTGFGSLPTQTCTTTGATSCTVANLTNGITYAITVVATNDAGSGPASSAITGIAYPSTVMTGSQLQLWLDGKDVDGDGVVEGSAEQCDTATSCATLANVLKRWKDKSGSAHDAVQSTTLMAGTYAPASGAVSFSGNGYYQAAGVGVGPDVTAFSVAQSATATWNAWGWLLGTRAGNGFVLHPQLSTTTVYGIAMWGSGSNNQAVNTAGQAPSSITVPHLYSTLVSGTSTVTANFGLDANVGTTGTGTGGTARAASSLTLTIGADDYDLATRRGNGSFRETLVFNTALTTDDRRAVQEYLGRKWGLTITAQPPRSVLASPNGAGSIKVSWTAPAWDGGSAPTDYTVQYRKLGTTPWTTWSHVASTATNQTLTGLTSGSTYEVQVATVNALGTGPYSDPSQGAAPSVVLPARWGAPMTGVAAGLQPAVPNPSDGSGSSRAGAAPGTPTAPGISRGGSVPAVVTFSRAGAGR